MKLSSFIYFAKFGIKTILLQKKDPILGTIILTDKCNLKCKHCSVNNIQSVIYPYEQIRKEMKQLYQMGCAFCFFAAGRHSYGRTAESGCVTWYQRLSAWDI